VQAKPRRKGNRSAEKRIAELTKERYLAEGRAQAEAEARKALEARLAKLEQTMAAKPAAAAPENKPPAEPRREEFTSVVDYLEAKLAWQRDTDRRDYENKLAEALAKNKTASDKAAEERERKQAETAAQQSLSRTITEKIADARTRYEDYDDVVTDEVAVSEAMVAALQRSPNFPDLQYYLGKHPEEIERLLPIQDPSQVLLEFGKITAKIESQQTAATPAKPRPASSETVTSTVRTAPKPPTPERPRPTANKQDYDYWDQEGSASQREYERMRAEGRL